MLTIALYGKPLNPDARMALGFRACGDPFASHARVALCDVLSKLYSPAKMAQRLRAVLP